MYVDKKLAGLQAVQTLARLNRTHPLKTKTFVLDFQNTMEEIREAFAPYFETTALEERTDLNQIYDLEKKICGSTYIVKTEVHRFAERFYKENHSTQSRLELEGIVRCAVFRFEVDEDDAQQEEFRQLLRSFMRFYAFVAQVATLNDSWLEKLYVYSSWLSRLLPSREVPAEISLDDEMLALSAFRLSKEEEGKASLEKGDTDLLSPISEFGANEYTEEEEKTLSEIVESFNERHGMNFSKEDFLRFERVENEVMDEEMTEMLRNNPADVVYNTFSQAIFQGIIKMFQQENEMRNIVLTDQQAREQVTKFLFMRAQRKAQA
jgi:type I restriction enzyme R subunit